MVNPSIKSADPKHHNPCNFTNNVRFPNPLSETANIEAGLEGLWRLARKANRMALAWKLMSDMVSEGVGVNECILSLFSLTRNGF